MRPEEGEARESTTAARHDRTRTRHRTGRLDLLHALADPREHRRPVLPDVEGGVAARANQTVEEAALLMGDWVSESSADRNLEFPVQSERASPQTVGQPLSM